MSRKNRPTAASWDSDEDLLQDDILGISAFQNTKEKEESDEDLDEDALLGSDNEYSENTKESNVKAEKIPSTSVAGIPSQTTYSAHIKRRDEIENYELLEVPSDADFEGADVIEVADPSELDGFETGQGNLPEDANVEHFAPSNIGGQSITELSSEPYSHSANEYESFQSQEEDYEDKTIKGFEESSESEDEEKGRGRFISERSNIISIATTKTKTRTDIPDTLEISEEQQAQIDQFLNERNRRGGRRGYRGGHDNRVHARQVSYNAWASNTTATSSMQTPSHLSDKRTGSYKVQNNPNITVADTEVYPITITGRGSYNQHHSSNQHHIHQANAQQQPPQQHVYRQQQQHHHHHVAQQQQQQHHPDVHQHPPPSPNSASTPQVIHHPSHMYQQQPQHPAVVTNQPHQSAAVSHHYNQPVSMPSSAPLATPPSVVVAPTSTNPSQQQGRKILINPHFRGAKIESQPPPVIPSSSPMATSTPMIQQQPPPPQRHRHYQPVPQQSSYVQPNPVESWPPTTAPPPPHHSYPPSSQPVMQPQTHYTPVSQPYQAAAPHPQNLQPPPPLPPPPPVRQMSTAPPMPAPVPPQINTVPPQYSGAPQPIQSLAPVPNQQPPSVYHLNQPYQPGPAPVPTRPVSDQSMVYRQTSQSHLMPAPQAPPNFMPSPPAQSPHLHHPHHQQQQQHQLQPSQVHSMPQHQPSTAAAVPPIQQPYQPRPQYQVQPVQPSHHEVLHSPHHMSKGLEKMPPPAPTQYGNGAQQIRTSTRGNFPGRISTFNKLHRKYQRLRVNPLVSPKRNRQEIQSQQNKNIKVLTTLPQVKIVTDSDPPMAKVPKVSTHLKQLTQSDEEESKSLREKLEQQKRMRAEVIRRKELRRLLQAEQRRKDLHEKLAEQGLTLADVTEEQKAHILESLPKKNVGALKSLTSHQFQMQPGKKQQILGKRPLQNTPVADGMVKNSKHYGNPAKQAKTSIAGKQEKDKADSRLQTNPSKHHHQQQSASNVILSEEEKNFYQKQYIPPHQQFQSISTPKKGKQRGDMMPKHSDLKANDEQRMQGRGSNENLNSKLNSPPGHGSGFMSPQHMPNFRPMQGGKMKMLSPRTQFGGQPCMPSPNSQMPNANYEGQNFPPPNQGPQRPMGMRSPMRPGQNQGPLRPPGPAGMRQQAPGSFRHPSPSGMRPSPRPGLRHFGPQSSFRPMRGQPRLLGPPNQSHMPQDQFRPICPQQQRFMHPSSPQRHLIPHGRGGLRGMMSRGRGMQPGRGGHLMPMIPPQGSMTPDFPQQFEGNIPKQELMKKTRLILKKVKNSVGNKNQGVNAKKVFVRKVNQSNPGGPSQNANNLGTQQGNRQGSNTFPNQERQMKFQNPGMGRGKMPPQRHPGPMSLRKVPGNIAINKDQSNMGRRIEGEGTQKVKKATMIAVDNLSSSTTERTMHQMAKSCGIVESLQLLKSQRKALIRFRTGDQAQKFFKKFHRHMLDLSHINVTVLPAS
ncbi:RNA-binding protein 33-like isoform X1 [Argonauta hians]